MEKTTNAPSSVRPKTPRRIIDTTMLGAMLMIPYVVSLFTVLNLDERSSAMAEFLHVGWGLSFVVLAAFLADIMTRTHGVPTLWGRIVYRRWLTAPLALAAIGHVALAIVGPPASVDAFFAPELVTVLLTAVAGFAKFVDMCRKDDR